MSDKNDDLERKARDTVFEKIDETVDGRPKQKSVQASAMFSEAPSSMKGEKGELDKVGSSDFSFVPEQEGAAREAREAKSVELVSPQVAPVKSAKGDVPFGESPAKEGKTALVSAMSAASAVKPPQPVTTSQKETQEKRVDELKKPAPAKEQNKTMPRENAPQEKNPVKENISAAPAEAETEVAKSTSDSVSNAEEMEVVTESGNESTALSSSVQPMKAVSKWAFWKRGSQRDEQLNRISDGYVEMVELVRAIRGQLESQNENNIILRDSLAHLPETMKGLDRFNESQHTVGEALKDIHGQMQLYSTKEGKLADSMDGFNSTLKGMDHTSKATMQTFDRVQERIRDSDNRMQSLFENVQNTEEKVSDSMVRLQRNMAIIQSIFLVCLLAVIGVLAYIIWESKQVSEATNSTNNPMIESPNQTDDSAPVGVTPREPIEVVVPSRNRGGE